MAYLTYSLQFTNRGEWVLRLNRLIILNPDNISGKLLTP